MKSTDDGELRTYEIRCHLKKIEKKFGYVVFLLYLCSRKKEYIIKTQYHESC